MTEKEFKEQWWPQLMARFPSVAVWYDRLPDEARSMQTSAWFEALAFEPITGACEVLKQIHAGNLESWPEFNREQIGAHVARLARAMRAEKESRSQSSPLQSMTRASRRVKVNLVGWYQRILDLFTGKSIPIEEACKKARAEFAVSGLADPPRFSCKDCLDSGTVTCWHPDTITRVLNGDDPRSKYVCEAPCKCVRGDRHIDRESEHGKRTFRNGAKRYDIKTHCPVTNSTLPSSEVELIKNWAEAVAPSLAKPQPGEWVY